MGGLRARKKNRETSTTVESVRVVYAYRFVPLDGPSGSITQWTTLIKVALCLLTQRGDPAPHPPLLNRPTGRHFIMLLIGVVSKMWKIGAFVERGSGDDGSKEKRE